MKIECKNGFVEFTEPDCLEFLDFISEAGIRFDNIHKSLDTNDPKTLSRVLRAAEKYIVKLEYKVGETVYTEMKDVIKNCPSALLDLLIPFAGALYSLVMKYMIANDSVEAEKKKE